MALPSGARTEEDDRGAPIRGVLKSRNLGVSGKDLSNDLPLYPDAAAMNDAYLDKASLPGLVQILLHHALDLSRLERVQIDPILDWHLNRFFAQACLMSGRGYRIIVPMRRRLTEPSLSIRL